MMEGGCLCGAVRYRVEGPPLRSGTCHCRSCRKTASSTQLPFAAYPTSAYRLLQGEPVAFNSSPGVVRTFCGRCGSPLTYAQLADPDQLDVMTGSLDEPDAAPATYHVFVGEKLGWDVIGDGLPAYEAGRD
jgi:hypothetical protein